VELPRVTFASVPDDVERGHRRVAAAVTGLSDVVAQGLTAYGQELVRGQGIEANLNLTKGLDEAERFIRERPAISVAELKERLGEERFARLDPAIREQPLVKKKDPATGKEYEEPADVPTWAVADVLFDVEAERALGGAEKQITVGRGWQGRFREVAAGEIQSRKARLNQVQLEALHAFTADTRKRQIIEAAESGDFGPAGDLENLGGAGAMLNASVRVLGAEGMAQLREQVLVIKQTKPVYDALRMVQVPAYREEGLKQLDLALASLGDPSKFTSLKPEGQAALASQVRAAADAVRGLENQRAAAAAAFRYADGATDPANPRRIAKTKAYDLLEADVKAGKLTPEAAIETGRLLGEVIKDRNDAAKDALGEVAGVALDEFMAIGPDGQPRLSFSNLHPETLLTLRSFGKDGQEVIEHLVRWDTSAASQARADRQLPTADQDARALAIERAVRRDPDTFRKMKTADLLAILTGRAQVPGEADAPAVALSSRDLPRIRDMLGANAAQPSTVQIVSPQTIAQQEFERAFGLTNMPSKRWSEAQRKALSTVTDEVARWVNGERAKGRDPSDDQIRAHLVEQGGLLHRLDRKTILGIPYGPRTPLEAGEAAPRAPEAAPAAPGAAPAGAAAPAPRARAANLQQVPLEVRQRIIDDWNAHRKARGLPPQAPSAADIVRGYNAGVQAGEL
jgi:hypothetical protein